MHNTGFCASLPPSLMNDFASFPGVLHVLQGEFFTYKYTSHYRKIKSRRVFDSSPCVFFRAHGEAILRRVLFLVHGEVMVRRVLFSATQ